MYIHRPRNRCSKWWNLRDKQKHYETLATPSYYKLIGLRALIEHKNPQLDLYVPVLNPIRYWFVKVCLQGMSDFLGLNTSFVSMNETQNPQLLHCGRSIHATHGGLCESTTPWWGKLIPGKLWKAYASLCSWSGVGCHHDNVVNKWKHFRRYWPFVRVIHRSLVNSPHKGQWRGALIFSLICTWTNGYVNNRDAGELRRHRAHYDVIVMPW